MFILVNNSYGIVINYFICVKIDITWAAGSGGFGVESGERNSVGVSLPVSPVEIVITSAGLENNLVADGRSEFLFAPRKSGRIESRIKIFETGEIDWFGIDGGCFCLCFVKSEVESLESGVVWIGETKREISGKRGRERNLASKWGVGAAEIGERLPDIGVIGVGFG